MDLLFLSWNVDEEIFFSEQVVDNMALLAFKNVPKEY